MLREKQNTEQQEKEKERERKKEANTTRVVQQHGDIRGERSFTVILK